MKKLFLLTKMLLAAVLLCVGQNAWADGNKRLLDSQNYEAAENADWTSPNGVVTLITGDATYGKYAQVTPSGSGNRSSYKSVSYTPGSGYTTSSVDVKGYNIELDFLLVGGNVVERSVSQFIVPTTGPNLANNTPYSGSDFIFSLTQPSLAAEGPNAGLGGGKTGTAVTTWYINDLTNATDATVDLNGSTWYHLKLVVTASSVSYSIVNNSSSEEVANGSKVVESLPTIKGFFDLIGRGSGKLCFDNLEIYDYTEEIVVAAPTFAFKKVDGDKRIYTLSNPNGSGTLYYTTSPAGEAPATGDAAYSSTASTSLDVEYDETGTYYAYVLHSGGSATSSVTSQAVTVGAVTLNAPVFKIEDMVLAEDGFYYPKVSFTSDNSDLPGSPTATFDVASPYTFTSAGYVDVTASADGYTSSTSRFTVSTKYSNTKTINFGALNASDFDAGTWTFGTGVPRDKWTDSDAAIPADVDMCKLTNTSTTYGDPDNSAVVDGITISNYNKSVPEFCIGYGMYTPYNGTDGKPAKEMNFTVNGAVATDYVVYNGWNNYGAGTFNTVQAGNATFALYRYDTMLRTIKVYSPATVSKTITSAGYATYCSPYALDFSEVSGLKAYIITGTESGSTLALSPVTSVPANTGILLQGPAAEYTIPVVASADAVSGNKLVGVTSDTPIEANAGYVLMDETAGVGFYQNNKAFTVGANTAYLPADFASEARSAYFLEGVTAVEAVEAAAAEAKAKEGKFIENGKLVIVKNGQKFNAAGQQVK